MKLEKEDWKLVPLATIGLVRGIGEVFIKPMLRYPLEMGREAHRLYLAAQAIRESGIIGEIIDDVEEPIAAAINYYTTGEDHGRESGHPHTDNAG